MRGPRARYRPGDRGRRQVDYAVQIARDWNATPQHTGFVTSFDVETTYLDRFDQKVVGDSRKHVEYWIPAEDLEELIRHDNPGRTYCRRKLDEGKTKKEAIPALKRHIAEAVWRQFQTDRQHHCDQDTNLAERGRSRATGPLGKAGGRGPGVGDARAGSQR